MLIAFHSSDDKRKVMEGKRKLKDRRNFRNIFIEHDLPMSQRMMNSNLRNIVRTIGKHQLELRGSRVQFKTAKTSATLSYCSLMIPPPQVDNVNCVKICKCSVNRKLSSDESENASYGMADLYKL